MCLETSTSTPSMERGCWPRGWLLCTVHQCQGCCLPLASLTPNSAQWLEYSAPENTYLLISILLERFSSCFRRFQVFLSSLPQAAWWHFIKSLAGWLREATESLAKRTKIFPFPWGRSKVISDWEFHILKPQDNRRLKLG